MEELVNKMKKSEIEKKASARVKDKKMDQMTSIWGRKAK